MKILIDADGCPVVNIILDIAKKYDINVLVICDNSHIFNIDYAEIIVVDRGADSVDFVLINKVQNGDIVVTQDYGLAAMVLSKRGICINQNGLVFTNENMDELLLERHISKVTRRSRYKFNHFRKRTPKDDELFLKKFEYLLLKSKD